MLALAQYTSHHSPLSASIASRKQGPAYRPAVLSNKMLLVSIASCRYQGVTKADRAVYDMAFEYETTLVTIISHLDLVYYTKLFI